MNLEHIISQPTPNITTVSSEFSTQQTKNKIQYSLLYGALALTTGYLAISNLENNPQNQTYL